MDRGICYAALAYGMWGFFPVYWKMLGHVPALELTAHRIVWSLIVLAAVVLIAGKARIFSSLISKPRVVAIYSSAAVLLSLNWLIYVWAVNAGFIVESALGYFINPLVSVLLGVMFLRERLRPGQWVSVALAAAGVGYLTFIYGALPWIALSLAFSFGIYGLVKKTAPLDSLTGLTLETGIMFIPAALLLIRADSSGQGAFLHTGIIPDLLLVGGGVVTAMPLLLFSAAARRIPLFRLGMLQYIAPTIQFLLGIMVYHEPFAVNKLIGFILVWLALLIFALEGLLVSGGLRR